MESCMTSTSVPPAQSSLSLGTSTFHPLPPNSLSLSSSSSATSSSASGSGSTSSGSNTGLNARTPVQSIPPSTSNGVTPNLYQVHDGFATVRKRKGPTAASIALRQQQECYDLAQPSNIKALPPKSSNLNKRQGSFMQKASFRLGSSSKDKKSIVNSNCNGNGSASLLSTHSSLALKQQNQNNNSSKNGFSLIPVRKGPGFNQHYQQSHSLLDTGNKERNGSNSSIGTLNGKQHSSSGNKTLEGKSSNGLISNGKDYRRNSVATSSPWETSGSSGSNCCGCSPELTSTLYDNCECSCSSSFPCPSPSSLQIQEAPGTHKCITNSDIHKTRLKPSASSASNSSLGRKLRRLVLPNKLSVPPSIVGHTSNPPNGFTPPNGYGHPGNENDELMACECSNSMGVGLIMSKSPSASVLSSCNSSSENTMMCNVTPGSQLQSGGKLRNSISDNSIVVSNMNGSGGNGSVTCHRERGVPGDSNSTVLCQSNGQARHFHRSCFLPKAPLEPVMEDGIPWRQTRKDVPWWELATRRGRYRSCPILQVSQQAHVVAAFEQSLSNMTQRIQSLTSSAEQKDTELIELRHTIELLRKQSIEAGLTVASMTAGMSRDGSPIARQLSADSVSSINSISSACSCTSHSHTSSPSGQVQMTPLGTPTHGPSANCVPPDSPNSKKKHAKNKGWLRSSFTKAFSRSKVNKRNGSSSDADCYDQEGIRRPSDLNSDNGTLHGLSHTHPHLQHNGHHHNHTNKQNCGKHQEPPGSPLLSPPQSNGCSSSSGSHSPRSNSGTNASSGVCEDFGDENKSVDELKKQLREKEMVLTDIRLEALTSAHQLESLKETVTKMRNEMLSLKQDNDRLQKMVTCKSLTSSQSSLQMITSDTIDRRLSASEVPPPSASNLDVLMCEDSDKEGKRIVVTVFLGCHGSYERYISSQEGFPAHECNIGSVSVSNKTKWDVLDAMIKRTFKEYLTRVDPVSNLGLSADSILSYNVGEVLRAKDGSPPELLPCGYLVGDVTKIRVCLKGAIQSGILDALAFETLVPKSILQRYITLLADHGKIILCGPSGTGKSYLARKIGEFLVARCGKDPCPEAIATFSADHKNNKELRQYLANLAEQCESGSVDLPSVIILDNLHQVSSFGEVFSGYLNSKQSGGPVIIGTMSQSTASTANLQLHHNFRWVLFGNHMEPVKGILSRYLQRRLVDVDVQNSNKNLELARVMDWIPKVWQHINKFLEIHNSSEVTIGPRLFLSCPTDVANSQVWFTDLWHYSIIPYLIEAIKEGLQLYGRKAPWEDPCHFLLQTYPWSESHSMSTGKSSLLRLRPEDVGYDVKSEMNGVSGKSGKAESSDADPLMNMLMRLQEAANYSGPQSNESDNTSLDSRTSLDSKDFTATA